MLHLGQSKARYRLGDECLDSCSAERDLGVLVNSKLNVSQQCDLAANMGDGQTGYILEYIKHSRASQSKEVIYLPAIFNVCLASP